MEPTSILLCSAEDVKHLFIQSIHPVYIYTTYPSVSDSLSYQLLYSRAQAQVALILLNNAPKYKGHATGNSDMTKKVQKGPSLSYKQKYLDLKKEEKKKRNYVTRLRRPTYSKNRSMKER